MLEARAFDNIYHHLDDLSDHFLQPDAWSILANLIDRTVLLLIAFAKALSLGVVAFGLVATAVCALLGPTSCRSSSSRTRLAVLGVAEVVHPVPVYPGRRRGVPDDFRQFVFRYVTTLPPAITAAEYGSTGSRP